MKVKRLSRALQLSAATVAIIGAATACSSDPSEPSHVGSSSSSVANSGNGYSFPDGANIISLKDIQLKTMGEAEAILDSGSWTPKFKASYIYEDVALSRESDAQKKLWIVVNACFPKKDPKSVIVAGVSPSEMTDEIRKQIGDGNTPFHFPKGTCVDDAKGIDIDSPPN